MNGFLTVCFSDWNESVFKRGIMRVKKGERTNCPIRRPLRPDEKEGVDYYIKTDPDFDKWTYSRCHRALRRAIQPGDVLVFRTLWRGKEYLIGYFTIKAKRGDPANPVCVADPSVSSLLPYVLEITPSLVRAANPNAVFSHSRPLNQQINEFIGRNFLRLSPKVTNRLVGLIDRMKSNNP